MASANVSGVSASKVGLVRRALCVNVIGDVLPTATVTTVHVSVDAAGTVDTAR